MKHQTIRLTNKLMNYMIKNKNRMVIKKNKDLIKNKII